MLEAGRSMIDGMMGYLGEMATPLVGDQMRVTAIQTGSGLGEASSRDLPVVDNEFRSPAVIDVWG